MKSVYCLSNSSSLHMSIKGSHDLPKIPRALRDNNNNDNNTLCFRLPYLPFSNFAQRKIRTLIKRYCSNLTIKLAFSSFKIKDLIKVQNFVLRSLLYSVVYRLTCAGCNSEYVGETCRHISTRICKHLGTDKNSHIFKHLQSSKLCKDACNDSCLKL